MLYHMQPRLHHWQQPYLKVTSHAYMHLADRQAAFWRHSGLERSQQYCGVAGSE